MQSKNKPAMTAAERRHVERLSFQSCVVCDAVGVEIHEFEQGLWFAAVPLCPRCHRDPKAGWHGCREAWKLRKMDQLTAIDKTIRRLFNPTERERT